MNRRDTKGTEKNSKFEILFALCSLCLCGTFLLFTEFLHALLAGDGFAGAFAGAGVGAGALAADGQRTAMAVAAIAADVAQAGDVLLNLASEGALDGKFLVDDAADPGQFFFGQFLGPAVGIDAGLLEDGAAVGWTDAIDVAKAHPDGLVVGDVNACDTGHVCSSD